MLGQGLSHVEYGFYERKEGVGGQTTFPSEHINQGDASAEASPFDKER